MLKDFRGRRGRCVSRNYLQTGKDGGVRGAEGRFLHVYFQKVHEEIFRTKEKSKRQ